MSEYDTSPVPREHGPIGYSPSTANSWHNNAGFDPALSPLTIVAERSGLERMKVNRVYNGTQDYMSWADADALFCAIDEQGWGRDYPKLIPYYWQGAVPPDMSKPFKCESEECDKWFSVEPFQDGRVDPNRQRFCDHYCAWRHRRNVRHRDLNVDVKCAFPECGKLFTRDRVSQLYCSRKCGQNHRNRMKGIPKRHRKEKRNGEKGSTDKKTRGASGAALAA